MIVSQYWRNQYINISFNTSVQEHHISFDIYLKLLKTKKNDCQVINSLLIKIKALNLIINHLANENKQKLNYSLFKT